MQTPPRQANTALYQAIFLSCDWLRSVIKKQRTATRLDNSRKPRTQLSAQHRRRYCFETLEARIALAAEPIITEFMASNDDTLLDDNGNSTDWIELFNAGDTSVNLQGYRLTDDPLVPDKWIFPSATLAPKTHMVVFAGDDADPLIGTDLYTGFRLSTGGEYLALLDPTGTVLSEFESGGSNYPVQFEDLSYGLTASENSDTVLAEGASSDYVIANSTTGPGLEDVWHRPDYVLGSNGETWQSGPSGFGYENFSGFETYIQTDVGDEMFLETSSLYIRSTFEQQVGNVFESLSLRARYDDGFVAYLNGVEILRENAPAINAQSISSIPLDNLFDDPAGTPLDDAIVSDLYQAEPTASDLGVYTVEMGNLGADLTIAPGVSFNLSSAGGGSGQSGPISNDTFRGQSANAIRTLGIANPPLTKVEDGIGIHSNGLITFDIDELRAAGGFVGQPGYFTTRSGLNDTAVGAGSVNTVAILSDDSGQVLAGYVNGQLVDVSNVGGTWSFTGSQPDILNGSADNRFAPIAVPVPTDAAYLTLAITGNGNRNSDHGVFSNPRLEFQSIALGNLFDDAKGTALDAAIQTDTPQAAADTSDLGVVAVGSGNFQSVQSIAPGVSFDLSNVSDSTTTDSSAPSNDTLSSDNAQPLRTRNIDFSGPIGTLAEDGIGLSADKFVTFDVEELRTAGGLSSDLDFRLRARAGINDSAPESASALAIVLASNSAGDVVSAWVNGQPTALVNNAGTWSLELPGGSVSELTDTDPAVNLDLALPSTTAYVTLLSAGGAATTSADHIVFSGARLAAVPDADGLSWESVASSSRGDSLAVVPSEFDLTPFLGLVREGTNVLAVQALNRGSNSSDFLFSHEIVAGDFAYSPGSRRYFSEPTPGSFNGSFSDGVAGVVDNVSYSVERGFYNSPISVALTTPTSGADIYYTTDSTHPAPDNPTATLYTGAVTVDSTTTLRAAAFKDDFAPSYIDTYTYVFLEDVIVQDPRNDYGNGVSPDNGLEYPEDWDSGVTGDYGMDPDVVAQWNDNNPANTDIGIRQSLLSLPSFSLTMEHGDAWRPLTDDFPGILTNARNRGEGFRHPASIEYFDPATGEHFQANAAVQAQGNSSRSSGSTRQHSYRLIFNETLGGPGKLNFPLFNNSDFADINTFTLKVVSTDGFSHDSRINGSTINPLNSAYIRDAYIRQLHFNTGNVAADSSFAHVYINGLYWGLYTPIERPDDAFFSDRFGGEREDWDIFRDNDEFISGNNNAWIQMRSLASSIANASPTESNELFQRLQGNNPDGSPNPDFEPLMDVDNFIDFYAIHMSSNTGDWPHRNWYAARNRLDPGKGFQFIAWDQGQSLAQDFVDRTERTGGLGDLHRWLRNNSEYRLRFADRIQKHFFNDGALTLAAKQQTWADLADMAEPAIVAETARWGDSREGEFSNAFGTANPPPGAPTHPLYPPGFATNVPTLTIDNWRVNVNFVHDEVLPFGRGLFLDRMVADGLWIDSVAAPSFTINGAAQHGGLVSAGDTLGFSSGAGTIYYTTDGTDPRAYDGAIAGNQFTSDIPLDASMQVLARRLQGGQWSPLVEATFAVAGDSLLISEVYYHPASATQAELDELGVAAIDADEFEFIEIVNTDPTVTINLLDVEIRGGVQLTLGNATLGPGEAAIVVENLDAFEARFGTGLNVVGQWSGGLNNGGEPIELLDAADNIIQAFTYDDASPWPVGADGAGPALALVGPTLDATNGSNWIAAAASPGDGSFAPELTGDYDRNSVVDQADYAMWQSEFSNSRATNVDGNEDGFVSLADYTVWRDNLGATLPAAAALSLAEEELPADDNFARAGKGFYLTNATGVTDTHEADYIANWPQPSQPAAPEPALVTALEQRYQANSRNDIPERKQEGEESHAKAADLALEFLFASV